MISILLAEDDLDFGNLLKQYLEIHDFQVTWARDGVEALETFPSVQPDICVFDVMMPKMDGFSLAEKVVALNPEVPFVFLTARKQKEDKIKGLKLGANDYIEKPFEADVLVLKLQNILKRSAVDTEPQQSQRQASQIQIGSYHYNAQRFQLVSKAITHQLTEKESRVLNYLNTHKNTLIKREEILTAVWKNDDYFSGRSMDVFLSRLRKYFSDDPNVSIESIRGVGLEFKVDPNPS